LIPVHLIFPEALSFLKNFLILGLDFSFSISLNFSSSSFCSLFSDTKKLEREIDGFVDILSEVGLVFKSIVPTYLNHSANGKFDEMVEKVKEMESKADKITKEVEHTLYEETLIPDARSDVLRLLEHMDELMKEVEFYDTENPRKLLIRVRRFFKRSGIDVMETNIFRGLFSTIQKKLNK